MLRITGASTPARQHGRTGRQEGSVRETSAGGQARLDRRVVVVAAVAALGLVAGAVVQVAVVGAPGSCSCCRSRSSSSAREAR